MKFVNHFRTKLIASSLAAFGLVPAVQATVVTFDTQSQLTSNFNLDVFTGDTGTMWLSGYANDGSYARSDGGFVHFNNYDTPDSLQFKSGPVFLNGFSISSQYGRGGAGVNNATAAGRDFVLELYDGSDQLISSRTLLVGTNGNWDFVTVDTADVRSLRILATWSSPGVYDGWWPNIDNVTFNQPATDLLAVPEPGAVSLVLAALGGLALTRRRRNAA